MAIAHQRNREHSAPALLPCPGAGLHLRFFGEMQVQIAGVQISKLRTRKSLALLAILAMRPNRNISREWISAQLWPESDDRHANRSLRQCLFHLRKSMGLESWRIQSVDSRNISFDVADAEIDVISFCQLLESDSFEEQVKAIELYRGSFMDGFAEPCFLDERSRLEDKAVQAIDAASRRAIDAKNFVLAIKLLQLGTQLDPYRESSQMLLIEALKGSNDSAGAVLAYRKFRMLLRQDLGLAPSPEIKALYARIASGAEAPTPYISRPLRNGQQNRIKCKLPASLTKLIGRDDELESIAALVPSCRLLTLTGPGGVGKTRLASQAAAMLRDSFVDGCHFVSLSALTDGSKAASHLYESLSLPPIKEDVPVLERLGIALGEANILLVVDNCEHVLEEAANLIDRLLAECPDLHVLATSRQALGNPGEKRIAIEGLTMGSADVDVNLETWKEFPAVRLFEERARSGNRDFALSAGNIGTVCEICEALDGLPLAIELAAARVATVDLRSIVRCIGNEKGTAERAQTSSNRHSSLDAAFRWSWVMLSDKERHVLACLTVFPDSWELGSAEKICASESVDSTEIVSLLSSLVSKSLVEFVVVPDDSGDRFPARYRLLHVVRQFLCRQINPTELISPKNLLLERFVLWLESIQEKLWGEDQSYWFGCIELEIENIRAALDWVRQCGPLESEVRLVLAMARFWDTRGPYQEGRTNLEVTVSRLTDEVSGELRAEVLARAGWMAGVGRERVAASKHYERSAELFRKLNRPIEAAKVLNYLAGVVFEKGQAERAIGLFEDAISELRSSNDRTLPAALNNLAEKLLQIGQFDRSLMLLDECIALCRTNANLDELLAVALSSKSLVQLKLGCDLESRRASLEAIKLFGDLGSHNRIPTSLELLAVVEASCGMLDRAACLFGSARVQSHLMQVPLTDEFTDEFDVARRRCEAELGAALFDKLFSEGEALSLDRAIRYAVEASSPTLPLI